MPGTVNLSLLQTTTGSRLALVQAGQLTLDAYMQEIGQTQGCRFGWQPDGSWLIDFGRGILDPSGQTLDILEVLEVVKAMMPSPLRSAGKTIRLRGPMPGAAAALITRVCYAARVIVEVLDRTTGLVREIPVEKLERDRVRLVRPDTTELARDIGGGWVIVRTTQLEYRRRSLAPAFAYGNVLELAFLETNSARHAGARAQVYDGRHFAWVNDLEHLVDA